MSELDEPLTQVPREEAGDREEAIAYLTRTVLPVLEQAKAALASTGVTADIEASWLKPAAEGQPLVSFWCGERGVPSGAGLPLGDVVEFTFADGILAVSTPGEQLRRVGKDEEDRAIHACVNRAVARYYAQLEDSVR